MRAITLSGCCLCLLAAGCAKKAAPAAQGNLQTDLATIDFGTTRPGSPVQRTATLTNRGAAPVTVQDVALDGAHSTLFSVTVPATLTVAPSATLSLTLTYSPNAEGTHSASLSVHNDGSPATVTIMLAAKASNSADLCAGVTCDKPPACFKGAGTCANGTCTYKADVGAVCTGGACDAKGACVATTDLCKGITCNTSSPCFKTAGTCVNGSCAYQTDIGGACGSGGTCDASGACKGSSGTCATPPSPLCVDNKTIRTYAPTGVSTDNGCAYVATDSVCASSSCANGTCATCTDGVQNGVETDQDCGGGFCGTCDPGKRCQHNSDCTSTYCGSGRCSTPPESFPTTAVWATGVIEFSGEYTKSPGNWSAAKVIGAPDAYPGCDDITTAWTTPGADNNKPAFLTVGFEPPTVGSQVWVVETDNPDSVSKVTITTAGRDAVIYTNDAAAAVTSCPFVRKVPTGTTDAISKVRVDFANDKVAPSSFKEIDAIGIIP